MKPKQDTGAAEGFRTLAEHSPDIIDRFDREFRHVYVNAAGLALHGLPAERVVGRTIRETQVPEPYSSLWEERIRQVFATAKPMDVTDSFPSPTGLRWFESRCVPERDSSGSVRSVLVISREVTERRRTEEALRLSEAMFRGLFENTGVGIAMGDPNGRLTLVNPALSQMLGYSREELASMTLADITHLDDMEMEKPYIQEVLDGRR